MSFLGFLGHCIVGSGLQKLLEIIYAPKAVEQIFWGKLVGKAHFIDDAALSDLLLSQKMDVRIPKAFDHSASTVDEEIPRGASRKSEAHGNETKTTVQSWTDGRQISAGQNDATWSDIQEVKALYDALMEKTKSAEDVSQDSFLARIQNHLEVMKKKIWRIRGQHSCGYSPWR